MALTRYMIKSSCKRFCDVYLLHPFGLVFCKDCMRITSNDVLRCKVCTLEHQELKDEDMRQDAYEDMKAEYEASHDYNDLD